ncbi:MAG: DUF4135 domain-containing protein [Bacteriovoracaceae bacterium]|nr:DUF4135 domain-containing protein [Bacteriovoracaceae bacterium]
MNFIDRKGDVHNFGKYVHKVVKEDHCLFVKPRVVFWEYQLLSHHSTLRKNIIDAAGLDLLEPMGSLCYATNEKFDHGEVKEVKENNTPNIDSWNNFGELMAIATVFGIVDLHHENVLITKDKTQIVDIECLFFKCESPADSHLLPQKNNSNKKSFF